MSNSPGDTDCQSLDPASTTADKLNQLLRDGGPGHKLRLCSGRRYTITRPLVFTAPNQEIATEQYPVGEERAILVVAGPVADGKGHTTAVDGTCADCDGVKLRNVRVRYVRIGSLCIDAAETRPADQWGEEWPPAHPGRC